MVWRADVMSVCLFSPHTRNKRGSAPLSMQQTNKDYRDMSENQMENMNSGKNDSAHGQKAATRPAGEEQTSPALAKRLIDALVLN